MGKPHPIELRERVVAFVTEGNSNWAAARHFRVSPRFVNNMMILHRSSGSLAAARQGHPPGGTKLSVSTGISHSSYALVSIMNASSSTIQVHSATPADLIARRSSSALHSGCDFACFIVNHFHQNKN